MKLYVAVRNCTALACLGDFGSIIGKIPYVGSDENVAGDMSLEL